LHKKNIESKDAARNARAEREAKNAEAAAAKLKKQEAKNQPKIQKLLAAQKIQELINDENDEENDNETFPRLFFDKVNMDTYYIFLTKEIITGDVIEYPKRNKIANFILTVNSRYKDIETNANVLNITLNNGHRSQTFDIESSKLASKSIAERNILSGDFIFSGMPHEFSFFIEKTVSESKAVENYMVSRAGMHKHPNTNEPIWVASNGAFNKNGELLDDIKLAKPEKHKTIQCDLVPKNWERKVDVDVFYQFNKSSIVVPYLGFTIACLYKQRFIDVLYEKTFPILWNIGSSGQGKSSTVKIMKNILKMTHSNNLNYKHLTKFALQAQLDGSKNIPIILDENKPRKEDEQAKWLEIVNKSYGGDESSRGQKDMSTIEFKNDAPIITMSEFTYGDTSTLERCIIVDANRNAKTTEAHLEGYNKMKSSDYGWVGETMLWDALNISDEEILKLYDEIGEIIKLIKPDTEFRERPLHNHILLGIALKRLGDLCGEPASTAKSLSVIANLIEQETQEIKSDDLLKDGLAGKALQEIWEMHDFYYDEKGEKQFVYRDHIIEGVHYKEVDSGDAIALNLSSIFPVFRAWCRSTNTPTQIAITDIYKQIQQHPLFVERNRVVKFGKTTKRCLVMARSFFEKTEEESSSPAEPADVYDANRRLLELARRN
jgi:hypothetical protein